MPATSSGVAAWATVFCLPPLRALRLGGKGSGLSRRGKEAAASTPMNQESVQSLKCPGPGVPRYKKGISKCKDKRQLSTA